MAKLRQYITDTKPAMNRVFPFTWKTAERIIQKWTKKVLGNPKSWHAIRHTYVSLAREQGVSIEIVAANTGDSIATLLKIYSNPSDTHRRKVADEQAIYTEI
jgi:integrase